MRLTGALSEVAQITQTARGVVVSLPDILFDTNKATLKPNAQVALGKLAGIVSVFPNINLRIEGHTDSTGSDAINNPLSRDRANSVMVFLRQQGVAASRMSAEGYGSRIPVADNGSIEGRAKNRRVEIILAEGDDPAGTLTTGAKPSVVIPRSGATTDPELIEDGMNAQASPGGADCRGSA